LLPWSDGPRSSVVALAVGGAFGAATSLINDVSSHYGMIGSRIGDTGWRWAAEVASKLLDSGWAWAGLAIAAGWLVGGSARGAVAGVLALLAATTAYFGMDSVLIEGSDGILAGSRYEIRFWWLASAVLGTPLGVVGASIGRPGVIGLLAGLTLPVGATVQMIWLPGYPPVTTSAEDWSRVIVWVGAGVIMARFAARSRPSSSARSGQE
jgi:hypothetical protein